MDQSRTSGAAPRLFNVCVGIQGSDQHKFEKYINTIKHNRFMVNLKYYKTDIETIEYMILKNFYTEIIFFKNQYETLTYSLFYTVIILWAQ